MRYLRQQRLQAGISLLEILCSLVITAIILLVVANYFYNQSRRYGQVSQAAKQIQELAGVSYEWQTAQSQTDFKGISMDALQGAGLLPEDPLVQKDPWNGTVTLTETSSDSHYVTITLPNTPPDACANLRHRMVGIAHTQSSSEECKRGGYFISI